MRMKNRERSEPAFEMGLGARARRPRSLPRACRRDSRQGPRRYALILRRPHDADQALPTFAVGHPHRHFFRNWAAASGTWLLGIRRDRIVVGSAGAGPSAFTPNPCCPRPSRVGYSGRHSRGHASRARLGNKRSAVCGDRRGRRPTGSFDRRSAGVEIFSGGLYTFSCLRYRQAAAGATVGGASGRFRDCAGRRGRRPVRSRSYASLSTFWSSKVVRVSSSWDFPNVSSARKI